MEFLSRLVSGVAKRFAPHAFAPAVKFLGEMPRILISKAAYDTMYYIVDEAPEEFGWLGLVEREGMNFLISEVYMFEQEVSRITVDIEDTPDNNPIGRFFLDLIQTGGAAKANKIRAWMHSHVNMGVTPSGHYGPGSRGDLNQMHQFGQNGSEYFIMGIANKSGSFRFEIFFYDQGIRVEDVPWEIWEPEQSELRARVAAEVKAKAKTPPPPPMSAYLGSSYAGGGRNWDESGHFSRPTTQSVTTHPRHNKGGRHGR